MAELLRFRDDQPADEPAVSLDAFLDQTNAASVRIEAGDDVRRLGPVLDRVRLIEWTSQVPRRPRVLLGAGAARDGLHWRDRGVRRRAGRPVFFMRRCGLTASRRTCRSTTRTGGGGP